MKKYLISVDGRQYEVEVEEISETSPDAVQQIKKPAAEKKQPVLAKAGSEIVSCPMAGTILKVAVTAGQEVKKGQLLCVLEAMKMENEIVAPHDGIIAGVAVANGTAVNAGDPLVSFE